MLSKFQYIVEAQLEPYAEYEVFVYAKTRGGASNEMIERFTTSEGGQLLSIGWVYILIYS